MDYESIKSKILDSAVPLERVNEAILYALIKDGEIVYVGQTRKGVIRILSHVGNKDFDSYTVMDMEFFEENEDFYWDEMLDFHEEELIVRLNPKLNRSIKGCVFMSVAQIQKHYDMSYWNVIKILKSSDIKRYIFNSKIYYHFEDVDRLIYEQRYGEELQ